ncbi:MAG: nucleotidyltransferase domain-containing protein [bacterium]
MPLAKKEKDTIRRIAREYGVKRLWLFGSMLDPKPDVEPDDIDLAVEGIAPERFYHFYGKLFQELPKPVDLVDMADALPIVDDVRETGVIIFDEKRGHGKTEKSIKTRKTSY